MAIGRKYKILITATSIILILGLFYTFFIQIKNVSSGYIGVKATKANLINNEYSISTVKGYAVFMPLFTELTIYPTTIQTAAYSSGMKIIASDGNEFVAHPRVSYQLEETKIIEYFQLIKKGPNEFNNEYLKELVSNSYAAIASRYTTDSLIQNMADFDLEANTLLTQRVKELGLTLRTSNSFLAVPDSMKRMFQQRALTIQHALLAKEQIREVYAKANLLRLDDSLRYSVLNPLVIQKLFIDKWDGKLSTNIEALKAISDVKNSDGL